MNNITISGLARRIRRREISVVETVTEYLNRSALLNPALNALVRITSERALERASAIDKRLAAGEDVGPLAGIPVAIKDNMHYQVVEVTSASQILRGFVSPFSATAVQKLEDAGAVIIGVANMDEFAMGSSTENSSYGPTRNPRDLDRVPGGSSGGSAAAVAADMVVCSLGSDTGGSVRLPASFCGVVGVKPTYGRVSRYGLHPYASSFDQIGPITKNIEDARTLLSVIAGYDPMDSTSLDNLIDWRENARGDELRGVKVGVPRELFGDGFDPEIRTLVLSAIGELSRLGAKVSEISLPTLEYALAAYYLIASAEASANLQRYDGVRYGARAAKKRNFSAMIESTRSEGFGPEVQRKILLGTYILSAGYYDAYYLRALRVRALIQQDFARAFSEVDIIAGPVSPVLPFLIGEKTADPLAMYLTDVATVSANLTGIPAISVPCGEINGLPIGLQLMTNHFREKLLLDAGELYEQHRSGMTDPFPINPLPLRSLTEPVSSKAIDDPVERIATLASLKLSDEQSSIFSADIGHILAYVELLNRAETSAIKPAARSLHFAQHARIDVAATFDNVDGILANAPAKENDYFRIPPVLED